LKKTLHEQYCEDNSTKVKSATKQHQQKLIKTHTTCSVSCEKRWAEERLVDYDNGKNYTEPAPT